ncbi:MAG TPA: lactate racemase domain-containing protein [Thermoleophilia bacterium]|nr:lactate racemase domain-containing protein [Thermoleophilia bacterium]
MSAGSPSATPPFVFSGERRLPVELDCDFEAPAPMPALTDVDAALDRALDAPVGAPPLRELARGAGSVAIVVPDASRRCPVARLLPPLIAEIERAGVADDRVRIVIGCGLHRATTPGEKADLVGPALARRFAVLDAQGLAPDTTDLGDIEALAGAATFDGDLSGGDLSGGGRRPVTLNTTVSAADLVVAVGIVEPHLYAGYSGGVKAVSIGCAGHETIAWTHSPLFLDQPAVRLCRLDGNPFQQALRAIASATRLRFALNVVLGDGGGVAGLAAGDPAAAQRRLVETHAGAWLRRRPAPADLVLAGVPAPKDQSLYQASRAATYVGLAARPALADGGLIVFCADAPLGAGDGPGEENFGRLLAGETAMDLVERGCVEPLGPGGQRAYMMAKLMLRYRVGVLGGGDRGLIERMGLLAFGSVGQAVGEARRARGPRARALVIADGIDTVVELDG